MAVQHSQAGGPPSSKDGLRDGIETIAIVVVMVLLLKMFVAEAFVIPTGSMATTLLGAHKMVICPQCGYEFPVNCSSEREAPPGMDSDSVIGCICPNCRYQLDFGEENIKPRCVSGDRLVVGKYLYDLRLNPVEREDVVVFKFPENPQRHHEAINYIKRLIGKPGETIAIHQGDLYVYPGTNNSQAPRLNYADHPRSVGPEQWWQPAYMHQNDAEAVALFRQGKYEIVRKRPDKVLALRRLVYDNDHQAKDLVEHKFPPRWAPEGDGTAETTAGSDSTNYVDERTQGEQGAAWVAESPNGYYHPAGNAKLAWLRYRHLLAERSRQTKLADPSRSQPKPELITDFIGYDSWRSMGSGHSSPSPNWVGDLILECEVNIEPATGVQPQGQLVLELSRGVDRFQARWQVASGQCTLVRVTGSREERLESQPTRLRPGSKHFLRFANVDERLIVWVDRSLPFDNGVAYKPPRESGPFANDLRPAGIGASSAAIHIHSLRLWRDTYYTLEPGRSDATPVGDDWSSPDRWRPLRDLPVETLYVQPGHYLCLGDNSPESADSRSWGLVPDRLLLGRALLVYYPLRRAGPIE